MQFPVFMGDEGRSGVIRNDRRVKDHRKTRHDVSIRTDRVKIVALRKCSRIVSGAAIVNKKHGEPGIVQRRRLGNDSAW